MKKQKFMVLALFLIAGMVNVSAQKKQSSIFSIASKQVKPTAIATMVEYGPTTGTLNGHDWVDLGLPSGTRWATCNLGTDEVDQDGGHYRWGAITTYYEGEKYAEDDVQRDITSDANYDAAAALWGGGWHMPTVQDFAELMDHCTWEWTNIGRRKGLKVTSKHNGKYIFLPASGAMNYNCDASRLPNDVNKVLNYWTSSDIPGQNTSEAYYLSARGELVYFSTKVRSSYGYCIRPVIK